MTDQERSAAGRRARNRGVYFERAATRYLRQCGLPASRRQRGRGAKNETTEDRGDIEVEALPGWHVECKNYGDMGRGIRDALRPGPDVDGHGPRPRLGIVKRPGKNVSEALVVMTLSDAANLLGGG